MANYYEPNPLEGEYRQQKALADGRTPQRRGYFLEDLLYSVLKQAGLSPKTSYQPPGEQVDGAFYLDRRTYLLEGKWQADPVPASALYAFKGKVDGKFAGTVGIYVSMSGYSDDAVEALQVGKMQNLILFDQSDIEAIVVGRRTFLDLLDYKLRQAGEMGSIYAPYAVAQLVAPATPQWKATHGAQVDVGSGETRVLMLCEGQTDAVILEYLVRKMGERYGFSDTISVDIRSAGGKEKLLRNLPVLASAAVSPAGYTSHGIIVVVDSDAAGVPKIAILRDRLLELVKDAAIPVPAHVAIAVPTIEAWVGLPEKTEQSGLPEALKDVDIEELVATNSEVNGLLAFLSRIEAYADEPLWERDAREAVEQELADAEWDAKEGEVVLSPPDGLVMSSLDELRSHLYEEATIAAQDYLPYDDGEPVFDVDYDSIVDEALMRYEEQITDMGWKL